MRAAWPTFAFVLFKLREDMMMRVEVQGTGDASEVKSQF